MSVGLNTTSSSDSKIHLELRLLTNGKGEMSSTNLSAPLYNIISNQSAMPSTDLPDTGPDTTTSGTIIQESHTITYVFVILGVLLFLATVVSLVVCLIKRNKLDRIRHHLMPLYNFDPTDEEPHWEADLLEDDRDQQVALNIAGSITQPKLKFHSHGLDI